MVKVLMPGNVGEFLRQAGTDKCATIDGGEGVDA